MCSQVPLSSATFIDLKGKMEGGGKPPCRLTMPGMPEKLKMNLLRLLSVRALASALRWSSMLQGTALLLSRRPELLWLVKASVLLDMTLLTKA